MLDIRDATRIFGRKAAVDHVSFRIDGPAFDLLRTLSKFICLGMSLEQVVTAATSAPARAPAVLATKRPTTAINSTWNSKAVAAKAG